MTTTDRPTLAYNAITPKFGSELIDVTLLEMSDEEVEALQQLAAERGIVVVRDQQMSTQQQADFAHRLGPLSIHQTGESELPAELLLVQSVHNYLPGARSRRPTPRDVQVRVHR